MRKAVKLSFLLSVLLPCVGCDQATKSVARKLLTTSDSTSLLNGFARFEYVENPGGFLSIGAGLPGALRFLIFVIFAGTGSAMLLLLAIKEGHASPTRLAGPALVAGGGISNLIDRMINDGRVADFVSIGLGPARTGIFNVADVAVMAGAVLMLYGLIRRQEKPPGAA